MSVHLIRKCEKSRDWWSLCPPLFGLHFLSDRKLIVFSPKLFIFWVTVGGRFDKIFGMLLWVFYVLLYFGRSLKKHSEASGPFWQISAKKFVDSRRFGRNIDFFLCNVLPTKLWNTTAISVKLHFFTSQTAIL